MSIEAMKQALEAVEYLMAGSYRQGNSGAWDRVSMPKDKALDMGVAAINALRTAIQQAEAKTDEPVAYVCPTSHHAHDGSMEDGPDYLEWADEVSDYEKRVGTPLYTHPAPGVPDDVVRDAISTVREQYRGTDWGKAAECICDAIDAAMAAAQSQKGQP